MGAVYKGIQLNLDRPVAIKLLPAELSRDVEFVGRFQREARTLAKLQHSRIITIHGTTTLFAALNVADGTLIGQCQDRHRHQEWLKFLQQIDAETPADRELHLILDNYATHKHPKVQKWLGKHPRFHLHFTPTSASWLNMVERFFRDLTVNRLRRGVFHSVADLVAALNKYVAQHNREPKPFIWTAKATDILAKVARARKKLPRKTPLR
jgi:transposase